MDNSIVDAICKHIDHHFHRHPFSLLKLSFFGGEPLLKPQIIEKFVCFAKLFCKTNNIELMLDFTTNGTLISSFILNIIKNERCQFQITLDGNREQHNRIKFLKSSDIDTFSLTLNNIKMIQDNIPNSFVAVRINFDGNTLKGFDSIVDELKNFDRKRTMVIVKKVWQVDSNDISKEMVFNCLDKLFQNNFIVDYYSQGGTCFADRKNQVTFNFDGNVFKCTTITDFNENNSLGKLNLENGHLCWNKEKVRYLDYPKIADICSNCKLLPSCGGHCRKHISEGNDKDCFLQNLDMTIEEYAMKQFMINLIKNRIYATN